MAARRTSERGQTEQTAHSGQGPRDILRPDSLQLGVPTDAAARVKNMAKGEAMGVEARVARVTAPGDQACDAEQVIVKEPPPRRPAVHRLTRWTVHRKILLALSAENRGWASFRQGEVSF